MHKLSNYKSLISLIENVTYKHQGLKVKLVQLSIGEIDNTHDKLALENDALPRIH